MLFIYKLKLFALPNILINVLIDFITINHLRLLLNFDQ